MRRLSRGIAVLSLLIGLTLTPARAAIWDDPPHHGPRDGIVRIIKRLLAKIVFDDSTDMSSPHP
jgi:hypothetical protein